jgi:hypothetical protein
MGSHWGLPGEGEGGGAGVDVHNMRLNTAHCALVLYGVHIAITTPYADATHSGSCKTAAVTRTRQNLFREALARSRQGGSAGGRVIRERRCCAGMQ